MIISRIARALKRGGTRPFLKNDDGVTVIEFAAIAPVFFLLMGSIMETGVMLFAEYVLQTSVQDASRLVRTGQAQQAGMTAAQFKNEICSTATVITNCNTAVTVHMVAADSFASLSSLVPSYLSIGNTYTGAGIANAKYKCGIAEQSVALIATYDWTFTMAFMGTQFGNVDSKKRRRLAGIYIFQNEPFPTGGACV
jgi:Flp pilus assembly protein TadG